MVTDERIDEVTEEIYRAYGSSTGILFGIPSSERPTVRAIVKVVLDIKEK